MNNKLFVFLLTVSLITFSVTAYFIWQRYVPVPPPSYASQPQIASVSATLSLSIPNLNLLNLPVYPARLMGTQWEYSTKGVSHLTSTPWAGEFGNAVYYAHNWPNLFGKLHLIKVGEPIVVTSSTGLRKYFYVDQIEIVSPDQIRILAPGNDIRLTLFTCIGFLDSKRLVVTAR